mgnify:CR=1 FL=1
MLKNWLEGSRVNGIRSLHSAVEGSCAEGRAIALSCNLTLKVLESALDYSSTGKQGV